MENIIKKVWYVALIWRPNSWKSTFINALVDEKVSIVSPKPQTTQKCIRWIYNDDDSQIIFFDTPWVNEWSEEFFEHLKQRVVDSLNSADLIVRFIDSTRDSWREEEIIYDIVKASKKEVIEVYSKCDISKKEPKEWEICIESTNKTGFDKLLSEIKSRLCEWPLYYDEDYYTDQDYETRIAEIIREKIFMDFFDEVPYSVFVEIGDIEDTPTLLRIQAYIYTESDSQKKIIIGKWWQQLTNIWRLSRLELEVIYWRKIFLALRVKVLPKWKKNKKLLNKLY